MGTLRNIDREGKREMREEREARGIERSINYKFVCPECGGKTLHIVMPVLKLMPLTEIQAHAVEHISDGTDHYDMDYHWDSEDFILDERDYTADMNHFYRCADCGFEPKDENGEREMSDSDFNKWIRKNVSDDSGSEYY